jgi:hypothetical protein
MHAVFHRGSGKNEIVKIGRSADANVDARHLSGENAQLVDVHRRNIDLREPLLGKSQRRFVAIRNGDVVAAMDEQVMNYSNALFTGPKNENVHR